MSSTRKAAEKSDIMPFAGYQFYIENGGKLSEEVYNSTVGEACAEILQQTNGAALRAPSGMQEAVKLCECALVDTIAGYRETATIMPKGADSVNNDGLAIALGGRALPIQAVREINTVCARFLQWPVNLMCRWI